VDSFGCIYNRMHRWIYAVSLSKHGISHKSNDICWLFTHEIIGFVLAWDKKWFSWWCWTAYFFFFASVLRFTIQ